MLRESVRILRENTDKWMIRKIDECERIKEEEKKDRLALVQVKKRKYGIKKVSKEESSRLKMRTEERLEVARAKENLWRRYQDESRDDMDVEEEEMWQRVLESILELEEKEGKWKEPRKEIEKIQKRMMYKEGEGRGHEGDTRNDKMGRVKADQMHEVVVDGSDDERMPGEVVDGGGERMKMQEGRVNGRDDDNTRMPEDVMGGGDCNDDEAKNEILEMHESVVGGSGDDKRVAGDVVGDGDDNDRDDMEGTQDDAYEADERMRMHENVVGGGTDDSGIPGDAVRGGDGSDGAGVNDDREEGGMIMKCGERGGGHLLLVQGGQAQVRVGEGEGDDIARDRECDGGTGLYGSKRRHSGTFNLRNKTNTDDTISVRGLVEKWEFLGRKTGTSAPVPELEPAKFVFGQSNMGESPLKRRRMGTEDDQGHPVLGLPLARLQRLTGVCSPASTRRSGTGSLLRAGGYGRRRPAPEGAKSLRVTQPAPPDHHSLEGDISSSGGARRPVPRWTASTACWRGTAPVCITEGERSILCASSLTVCTVLPPDRPGFGTEEHPPPTVMPGQAELPHHHLHPDHQPDPPEHLPLDGLISTHNLNNKKKIEGLSKFVKFENITKNIGRKKTLLEENLEKFRSKETQIEAGRKKEVQSEGRSNKKKEEEEEGFPYLMRDMPETFPTCSEQRSGATLLSWDPGCSSSSSGAARPSSWSPGGRRKEGDTRETSFLGITNGTFLAGDTSCLATDAAYRCTPDNVGILNLYGCKTTGLPDLYVLANQTTEGHHNLDTGLGLAGNTIARAAAIPQGDCKDNNTIPAGTEDQSNLRRSKCKTS